MNLKEVRAFVLGIDNSSMTQKEKNFHLNELLNEIQASSLPFKNDMINSIKGAIDTRIEVKKSRKRAAKVARSGVINPWRG